MTLQVYFNRASTRRARRLPHRHGHVVKRDGQQRPASQHSAQRASHETRPRLHSRWGHQPDTRAEVQRVAQQRRLFSGEAAAGGVEGAGERVCGTAFNFIARRT